MSDRKLAALLWLVAAAAIAAIAAMLATHRDSVRGSGKTSAKPEMHAVYHYTRAQCEQVSRTLYGSVELGPVNACMAQEWTRPWDGGSTGNGPEAQTKAGTPECQSALAAADRDGQVTDSESEHIVEVCGYWAP